MSNNKKHWVDENHYRTVDDDGKRSYLYKNDGDFFFPDTCIEISVHNRDGTTDAYEPDTTIIGVFLNDCLGTKKNK